MNTPIQSLLSDAATQGLIKDLGIEGDTPEHQTEIMMLIGSNITKRLVLAFFEALPESTHAEFESHLGNKDIEGMRSFLEMHIPDLDQVIAREMQEEFEATLSAGSKQQL